MSFRILHRSTDEITSGTEFTYRLRLYGIPLTWRSLICDWNPGRSFVESDIKRIFRHRHERVQQLLGPRVTLRPQSSQEPETGIE